MNKTKPRQFLGAVFIAILILAGAAEAKQPKADILRRLTETPAYQATLKADLANLSNRADQGVIPGNLLPYKNGLNQSGTGWRFDYRGDDCTVVYEWTPKSGTLDDFRVWVDGRKPFAPAVGGGPTATIKRAAKSEAIRLSGGRAVKVQRDQDKLDVLWEYELAGQPVQVAWTFGMLGKSLVVSAKCDDPLLSQFSLGNVDLAQARREFSIPYLPGNVIYLPAQNLFVRRQLDWTKSHASRCPQGVASYDLRTDGTRNCLEETGNVCVSPVLGEVLPNIPHASSPYRDLLAPRIMLDIWDHHEGTFQGDAANLETLKDHGVDHLAIISHDWQRYGYDVKLPDHLPANPELGGDEGMTVFGETANRLGYLWSLHENYRDLYPDAPAYDSTARVLSANGTPVNAWFNESTQVQSFGLKCNRSLGYAKQNSPEIHRRFKTTAAYLDVHTCVPPWQLLDHEANQPLAAMALAKIKFDTELFQFMRKTHEGPLFGEGGEHVYWAGRCDGVEAEVAGGEDHLPLVDFDLLKIHPQMVNHGMGYYERWFRRGADHRWGKDSGSMEQIDKYRAQELAYGHAGFVGGAQVDNLLWVIREHHLMHPVQRLYGSSQPEQINYEIDGQLVTASVALVVGATSRQHIRYDSGLKLWVNSSDQPWIVEGRELPQWGFLALGPETEASTTLRDGKWSDYGECKDYIFADARTHFPLPYPGTTKDIEPRLREFKHLGGNRVHVTYEWLVNDYLDRNYECFVHGIHAHGTAEESIEFQQDHKLAKPTRKWRKGDVIVDGPYELVVSDKHDHYDLAVGLHHGERIKLKGSRDGADRVLVAKLNLERQNGRISNIIADEVESEAPSSDDVPAVDFTAHLNPPGTWVDFGKVATDGAVKIQREPDRLVLFPYPRNQRFHVSLDLPSLAPLADLQHVEVVALAAGTQQPLGPVDFEREGNRLVIMVGMPDAGRYVVTWDQAATDN